MTELAAQAREETGIVMIDATHLKAHRTASSLPVKRMARPSCKRRLGDDVISLHKRIRHVGAMAAAKMEIRAFRSS